MKGPVTKLPAEDLLDNLLKQPTLPKSPNGSTPPSEEKEPDTPSQDVVNSNLKQKILVWLQYLPKLKEYFLILVFIIVAGYLVKARFFWSIGVFIPPAIKEEFFSTGLLFLLFCSSIITPLVYVMRIVFRDEIEKSNFYVFRKWRGSSLKIFNLVFVVVFSLMSLFPSKMLTYYALKNNSNNSNDMSFGKFLIGLLIGAVGALVIIAITKRETIRTSWRYWLLYFFENIKKISMLTLSVVFFVFLVLGFMYAAEALFGRAISDFMAISTVQSLIFLTITFVVFMIVSLFVFAIRWIARCISAFNSGQTKKKTDMNNATEDWIDKISVPAAGTMITVVFLIHIYSLYIYPSIPQQIGGGEPRPIILRDIKKELNIPHNIEINTYIMTDTPEGAIIKIEEVQSKKVKYVTVGKDVLENSEAVPSP